MANEGMKGTQVQVVPALFSMKSAARYADCSPWTIRRKIYSGELTGVKLGAKLLIEKAELDRYIAAHRTKKCSQ